MKAKLIIAAAIVIVFAGVFMLVKSISVKGIKPPKTQHEKQIAYYTCGMHPSVRVSPEEYKKGTTNCPICNMKLTPVYKKTTVKVETKKRKILFYRNPMNPSITSKVPTKDEMGMDYIPVYEKTEEISEYYGCGMEGAEHVFVLKDAEGMSCPICGMPLKKISKEEADKLKGVVSRVEIKGEQAKLAGVRTAPVKKQYLYKEIRTVGKVAYDPQLAVTEEEYISALKALNKMQEGVNVEIKERAAKLVESSKRKLRLLGLSSQQIDELKATREIHTSYILPEEKMWIYGDIYEYELSWVRPGEKAKITTASYPGEEFPGVIASVNPVLDPKTRSVTFRVEVDNPDLKLQPQMYVDIVIMSMYTSPKGEHMVLAIPKSAVLDTGTRKIVWTYQGEGNYEGRNIKIGPEAVATVEGKQVKFYPVLKGLKEGEMVVTKANFLIDSQSQISGVAASAYGGALGAEEKKAPPVQQH